MAKNGFRITSDTLTPGLESFGSKLDKGLQVVMKYHEPQAEGYMRSHAPWRDRTTNARNGLTAKAISEGHRHVIVCFHQMPYGPWLEVRWDGRYRIIVPTIINQGREVMITVRGLLSRLDRG